MSSISSSSRHDVLRQVITLFAILSTFGINLWSNIFPINGKNIGELSNALFQDVLIIPANYAFIIWGVIYIGLFVFAAYQFRTTQRDNPRLRRGGYWLAIACLAQNVWVILFLLRQFAGSVVAMAAILISLIVYYLRLDIGLLDHVPTPSRQERWQLQAPISIYLGWISVATVVNVAIALYDANWSGWGLGPRGWTVVMLGIVALLAIWILLQRGDRTYPLVIVWAFVAIAIKHRGMPLIASVALSLGFVLVLFAIWRQPLHQKP